MWKFWGLYYHNYLFIPSIYKYNAFPENLIQRGNPIPFHTQIPININGCDEQFAIASRYIIKEIKYE